MPATAKTYELEGQLLEACSCNTPCPCWIGEDPDGGICKSFLAYHFDRGEIQGIDVSGQTLVKIVYIPGTSLAGNWRAVIYLDDKSSPEQRKVLLDVITGELGGPLASAEMAPYRSGDGKPTKLVDSIFSTIPGSPAYVAKASHHRVNLPEFNFVWEYSGKNAIQGAFRFEA